MSREGDAAGLRRGAVVRPMRAGDITGVAALAAGEATAPHWPVAEYHRMLKVIASSPGRRGAWVLLLDPVPEASERGKPLVGEAGNQAKPIIGLAMASHVAGICDLEAAVVKAEWRGRRFGEVLVEAVAEWGCSLAASRLELEVRASNAAALKLYRRMGFTIDGSRPGYYRNPDEEAVLMGLRLQP